MPGGGAQGGAQGGGAQVRCAWQQPAARARTPSPIPANRCRTTMRRFSQSKDARALETPREHPEGVKQLCAFCPPSGGLCRGADRFGQRALRHNLFLR